MERWRSLWRSFHLDTALTGQVMTRLDWRYPSWWEPRFEAWSRPWEIQTTVLDLLRQEMELWLRYILCWGVWRLWLLSLPTALTRPWREKVWILSGSSWLMRLTGLVWLQILMRFLCLILMYRCQSHQILHRRKRLRTWGIFSFRSAIPVRKHWMCLDILWVPQAWILRTLILRL